MIVGIAELAELLGVSRQRANQVAAKEGFPEPIRRLAMGPVWRESDVKAWIAKR